MCGCDNQTLVPSNKDSISDSELYPFGMNRRECLKYFGTTGMATGLAGCASNVDMGGGSRGSNSSGGNTTPVPPEEQRPFPLTPETTPDNWGTTLRWTTDNSAGPVYSMFGPLITEDTGGAIKFNNGKTLPSGNYYSKLNTELIVGSKPPYDIVLNIPLYLGDFQARGTFEPLDKYLAKYDQEKIKPYLDGISEPYKEFYMKWNGNTVALPVDGDIHNLFYQPSYFNDPKHQEQYKSETGNELRVPRTWPEYNRIAQYFTENTEDGVYGAQVFGGRPWNFGWWMNRAASRGVIYFNENMEPQINSDDAVTALESMVECMQYSPPGSASMGIAETLNQWQQANVVMCPWWIDLSEFTARGDFPVTGNQSSGAIPGWEQDDGSIQRNAMFLYNRLYSIPANLSKTKKEQAFYAMLRLSAPPVVTQAVADPYDGLDPSQDVHFTEEAIQMYTKPNPLRGTGEGFPKNVPIFAPDQEYPKGRTALEQARQHVKACQTNVENGFPQPNWPGASQYTETLSIEIQRALNGEKSPQQALDDAAESWRQTRDDLGRETQRKVYIREFFSKAKKLNYV
jgi:multiple sugar transport system substrate-binding protein